MRKYTMTKPSLAEIQHQVSLSLKEDLGIPVNAELSAANDITANLIDESTQAKATIITREACTICGIDWVEQAFFLVEPSIALQWCVKDGDSVAADTVLVTLSGSARGILTAERTALNFLQTLSATATVTAQYANILTNTNTKILDTRKTIPGMRFAQKYAVLCGGGTNHRIGLFDAFLIKENHIFACGSIQKAIGKAKQQHPGKPIEVEVENIDEFKQAHSAGADIVMLDNFTNEQIAEAVTVNQHKCKLEVSGNVTAERLQELAKLGVDYISSGALTKHIQAIDLSLRISMN